MAGAAFNKVVLIGRLTRDPELRYTPDGTQVASFTIAVNRNFKPQSANQQTADFIDITVWRKQAENCNTYLSKGSLVLVEGRLQIRNYEGKDGIKRKAIDVVANTVQFLETKRNNMSSPANNAPPQDFPPPFDDDSEVPF